MAANRPAKSDEDIRLEVWQELRKYRDYLAKEIQEDFKKLNYKEEALREITENLDSLHGVGRPDKSDESRKKIEQEIETNLEKRDKSFDMADAKTHPDLLQKMKKLVIVNDLMKSLNKSVVVLYDPKLKDLPDDKCAGAAVYDFIKASNEPITTKYTADPQSKYKNCMTHTKEGTLETATLRTRLESARSTSGKIFGTKGETLFEEIDKILVDYLGPKPSRKPDAKS